MMVRFRPQHLFFQSANRVHLQHISANLVLDPASAKRRLFHYAPLRKSIPFGLKGVILSDHIGRSAVVSRDNPDSPRGTQSPVSPIWQAAIENYYNELAKGGVKASMIDKELWNIQSPDELIAQIEALAPVQTVKSNTWIKSVAQLQPILLGINDFAALAAFVFGMNGKVAAVLWGSIRFIIKLAQPVLPEIIDMLENLQHALPRMQQYEQELPMTDTLEKALVDMYSEIIVFCAHAITFFRNNPNVVKNRHAWSQFSRDFAVVIANVRKYSRKVDEVADMIRLSKEMQTAETVAAIRDLQSLRASDPAKLPCYVIPYGLNLRFFGRDNEISILKEALDPPSEVSRLRAIGVHGLGGVGKSQMALHYANTSMDKYKVIAWIPSETQIKIVQAFSSLSNKLGLSDGTNEDEYQSVQKVRDWLNKAKKPFLLIFDNVDKIELLDQIWPASGWGSIIITTRSPSQASRRAPLTLALDSFSVQVGKGVLQALTGIEPTDDNGSSAADEICRLVGGLPLAMVQIGDFIRDRQYSYTEFLRVYKKSAEKVYSKSERPVEYDHTVLTTWEISLQKLSPEATKLQNLLVFFDPDLIPERLITNTKAEIDDDDLEFLFDEFDFTEAVVELTRTSMINRLSTSKALSMHRLVQFAVFLRLSKPERVTNFDLAVRILYYDFPNVWQARGPHQGHGWETWETCSAILPHVNRLMEISESQKVKTANPDLWAELVFRSGTYLWEKEQPALASSFFQYGLKINESSSAGPIPAQAYRLLGHVSLDLAQPQAALDAYKKSLALREQLVDPNSPPIADVCDSIACAYTEAGQVDGAFTYLNKATAIHNAHDPSKMSRTLAIRAMTCLRANQPEQALDAIRQCWTLQKMSQEQIEVSRYPKHSGDIMLLARIYWLQGKKADAQELASRTITMRRGTYGEQGGPRVADSLFTVARMLEDGQQYVLAARLLNEVITISGDALGMQSHLARALWFLANLETKIAAAQEKVSTAISGGADREASEEESLGQGSNDGKVSASRKRAKEVRDGIPEREWPDEDTDEGYRRLVSWMLW